MSITTSQFGGQLAAETYKQLLSIIRRELTPPKPERRRQNWRFASPEPNPALRAYWQELYQKELETLETEWAAPRQAIISADSISSEDKNVSISQAS